MGEQPSGETKGSDGAGQGDPAGSSPVSGSADDHPATAGSPPAKGLRRSVWKQLTGSPMRKVASAVGALILAAVSGVAGAAASGLFAGSQSATPTSTPSAETPPTPKLSVDSVVVSSTECTTTPSCRGLRSEDVDITIRNTGNADADMTFARIAVQQFKPLGAQSLPTGVIVAKDGTYGVQMPSQTLVVLHEDIPSPADGTAVARFDLEFLPPPVSYYVNLYRVGISLVYNTSATMPPIKVLIAVPRDPPLTDECSAKNPQLCSFLEHPGCRDLVMTQLDPRYKGALVAPCG
jgi:hypothetical protein